MGPTWVLSVPDWPHVGTTNLAIWDGAKEVIVEDMEKILWGIQTVCASVNRVIVVSNDGLLPVRRQVFVDWFFENKHLKQTSVEFDSRCFLFKMMRLNIPFVKRKYFYTSVIGQCEVFVAAYPIGFLSTTLYPIRWCKSKEAGVLSFKNPWKKRDVISWNCQT